MAFTFDSSFGGTTSNSYVSVQEADDYFAGSFSGAERWSALDSTQKQQLLVQSTMRIDSEKFGGMKQTLTQSLQFPRNFILDRDAIQNPDFSAEGVGGRYYRDSSILPSELKQAVYELALHYIKREGGEYTVDEDQLETVSSYSVGPLSFTLKGNVKEDRLPSKVVRLLKAIGPNGWEGGSISIKIER